MQPFRIRPFGPKVFRPLQRWAREQRGVSAVEFAIIAPLLIFIYLSCVEVTLMMRADRRVTATASTLGDLTARLGSVTNDDLTELYDAAVIMMQPYAASQTRMRITSVVDDGNGEKRVGWSEGHNMVARTPGALIDVPDGIVQQPGSVILTEVEFYYSSNIGFFLKSDVKLSDRFYLRPRRVQKIERIAGPSGSVPFGPGS
ncbi:MAG: TadE/TadG family type IV pilus assembly protein [Hyphomonas sp.]